MSKELIRLHPAPVDIHDHFQDIEQEHGLLGKLIED